MSNCAWRHEMEQDRLCPLCKPLWAQERGYMPGSLQTFGIKVARDKPTCIGSMHSVSASSCQIQRGSPILITLCRKSTFYVGWADDCTSLTETHIHASCEFRKFIPCRLFMTNQTCSLFKTSGMEHINRWCKTRTRLECAGQSAPVVIQS